MNEEEQYLVRKIMLDLTPITMLAMIIALLKLHPNKNNIFKIISRILDSNLISVSNNRNVA